MKKRRQLRLQPCLMLNEGEGRSGRRAGGGDGGGDDDGVGDGEGRMGRKWWAGDGGEGGGPPLPGRDEWWRSGGGRVRERK